MVVDINQRHNYSATQSEVEPRASAPRNECPSLAIDDLLLRRGYMGLTPAEATAPSGMRKCMLD